MTVIIFILVRQGKVLVNVSLSIYINNAHWAKRTLNSRLAKFWHGALSTIAQSSAIRNNWPLWRASRLRNRRVYLYDTEPPGGVHRGVFRATVHSKLARRRRSLQWDAKISPFAFSYWRDESIFRKKSRIRSLSSVEKGSLTWTVLQTLSRRWPLAYLNVYSTDEY